MALRRRTGFLDCDFGIGDTDTRGKGPIGFSRAVVHYFIRVNDNSCNYVVLRSTAEMWW